ncbi:hypothetical protein [Nocardia aurantia]|uniref:Uncharacterized protein n=1 Tax=Nocardia aurantia TaxID=2585199 RepID=A0A7K0DXD7_9NOCA|nr:hypothetical protein [Nocardia aurantia]MQY30453.1 hypothetical protein [Nocardia aurantia]
MAVVAVPRRGTSSPATTMRQWIDRGGARSAAATVAVLACATIAGAVATGSPADRPAEPPPAIEQADGDGLVDCDQLSDADYDDCIALTTGNLLWRGGTGH